MCKLISFFMNSPLSLMNRWSFGIFLWTLFLKCKYLINIIIFLLKNYFKVEFGRLINFWKKYPIDPMEKLSFINLLVLLVKVVFFIILIINPKFLGICKNTFLLFYLYIGFYFLISYAIIRDCLVEENHRPEMTRIRALLCHSKMLSHQAFQVFFLFVNIQLFRKFFFIVLSIRI
jgi:hypothetical protein